MGMTNTECQFEQEIRLAIVMYGGISLAIYMNGITQELYHLVRATAPKEEMGSEPLILTDDLSATEKVYRKLGQVLSCEQPGPSIDIEDIKESLPIKTRFVIDILSGSSAGGINAIFLAKALANNQKIDKLKELWIQEGDIRLLLNDNLSVRDVDIKLQNPPNSLLNSRRMYLKLLSAFHGMDKDDAHNKKEERTSSSMVDELDLYVTTTDITGIPVPLRLADTVVYERRHKNVFQFIYKGENVSGGPRNDLSMKYNPFLAFAARCTSSFPFAFEPMSLTDIDDVVKLFPDYAKEGLSDNDRWKPFYKEYSHAENSDTVEFKKRSFGDGGYLDNKPFTYAIEALLKRQAAIPVDRKLIYIEPSPEHPELEREADGKPDFIENAMAALVKIPGYETIREDLQKVLKRNRRLERMGRVTDGIEIDVEYWKSKDTRPEVKDGGDWAKDDLGQKIREHGIAYGGYHRLKVGAVSEDIAHLIANISEFDGDSDQFLAVLYLVRAWRNRKYTVYYAKPGQPAPEEKPSENKFLLDYDLQYRMRRLNYLRNKIDELYCRPDKDYSTLRCGSTEGLPPDMDLRLFKKELREVKACLNEAYKVLRDVRRLLWTKAENNPLTAPLSETPIGLSDLKDILEQNTEQERLSKAGDIIEKKEAFLEKFSEQLALHIGEATRKAADLAEKTLKDETDLKEGTAARECLWHYYRYYEDYDMIIFPQLNCQNGGENDTVEIIRISPEDATSIIDERGERNGRGRTKLAGVTLGHFGAFLEKAWRINDILWGRFDGAERIISSMLPGMKNEKLRAALIREANKAIIDEDLGASDRAELCKLLVNAIMACGKDKVTEAKLKELAEAEIGSPLNPGLEAILRSCMKEETLLEYFRKDYQVNRTLNPKTVVESMSRSTRIVGKMLEQVADKRQKKATVAWISRLGQVFWGFVSVAVPGSIPSLFARHWLTLIYLFEIFLTGTAIVFGSMDLRKLGLMSLAVTGTVHALLGILSGYMKGKKTFQAVFLLLVLTLCFFAIIGADAVFQFGLSELFDGSLAAFKATVSSFLGRQR